MESVNRVPLARETLRVILQKVLDYFEPSAGGAWATRWSEPYATSPWPDYITAWYVFARPRARSPASDGNLYLFAGLTAAGDLGWNAVVRDHTGYVVGREGGNLFADCWGGDPDVAAGHITLGLAGKVGDLRGRPSA